MERKLSLVPRTRELFHAFYRDFVQDPALFADMSLYADYHYDRAWVDARYDRHAADGHRCCLILLLGDTVIGDIVLHGIEREKSSCELGICLVSDAYKNRGFGTEAERLAVSYAFRELGLHCVTAEVIRKNIRSQHVLEKVGFTRTGEDENRIYYAIYKQQTERTAVPEKKES